MGQYSKAEPLYIEAKQIRDKVFGNDHPDYATSCNNLALLYSDLGQYEKAEELIYEAKRIFEKVLGRNHPDYAASCNNLASLYRVMAQYEKAELLFLKAKQIFGIAFGENHPEYATACNNLAALYQEMGQYEKAEQLFLETKDIFEKVSGINHPNYATSCNNLAVLYKDIAQYEKAESLFLEAKQIRERALGQDHPDYASSCNSLADFYHYVLQYEKAEPLFLEARQILKRQLGTDHPGYATVCNSLAALYYDMGLYEKAEPLILEAMQIWGKVFGKDHPLYATSCINLAVLSTNTGQYQKAERLLVAAKQILEKVLGSSHPEYALICANLANLYWLQNQPLLAEREYQSSFSVDTNNIFRFFQFSSEKEKAAYIGNLSWKNDNILSFYVSKRLNSGLPYSLSLFHRDLILSASQALKKQLFATGDTAIRKKYREWEQLRKNLAILYSRPVAERKAAFTQLEERADQLEKELIRLSSSFAKQQRKTDWKEIQKKLQAHEAAIEFASFRWSNGRFRTDTVLYVALVLRKDSLLPAMIPLFNEQQLLDVLAAAANTTKEEGIKALYTLRSKNSSLVGNKSAYELIWQPLENELKGINTIYFAPSGLLHRIAFAALPVTNTEVLSDRYKLVQLATTASVADQQSSFISAADKIQLYGNISYDADSVALKKEVLAYHPAKMMNRSLPDDLARGRRFSELPGTGKEITGIASLPNAYKSNITSRTGIHATEESLKALSGKASPGVIHIATHGFFFPDPKQDTICHGNLEGGMVFRLSDDPLMRSGIVFAGANYGWRNKPVKGIDDGILIAYEVANLYLPNTKLVVLSACETGLGDIQGNEGVYGLQRAFKIAGVQNVVMSLWKVPDAETAEFMQEFYKNLFAKQAISDAFYHAQKVMKEKYRSQPYKWAAWVLV